METPDVTPPTSPHGNAGGVPMSLPGQGFDTSHVEPIGSGSSSSSSADLRDSSPASSAASSDQDLGESADPSSSDDMGREKEDVIEERATGLNSCDGK
jgi:hypothetical protein